MNYITYFLIYNPLNCGKWLNPYSLNDLLEQFSGDYEIFFTMPAQIITLKLKRKMGLENMEKFLVDFLMLSFTFLPFLFPCTAIPDPHSNSSAQGVPDHIIDLT